MKYILMACCVLFLFVVYSCTPTVNKTPQEDNSTNLFAVLDPAAFKAKLEATPDAQLIDVRTPPEFEQGHLEGAINIDINGAGFEEKMKALDLSKPIFVYCKKGGRSAKAQSFCKTIGAKEVYDMKGGYSLWSATLN